MSDRSTFNPIEPPEPPVPAPQLSPTIGEAPVVPMIAVGREFGEYDLLEEIARGGMGVVFAARQRKLSRRVALKMILAGQLARPADVQRFQAEARAAAALDHPNIVPIHEIGEQDGQHYFTMKLIEGGSLQAYLPMLRGDARTAARLLAVVARAAHFAHEKGVLHRDLKPGNVLIEKRDEELVPHLTDFGLAKVLNEASLTASGAIVGTPAYMAPEQASSGTKPVTPLSDVYSLGAILYEILTGQPPFQAATAMEVLLKVMTDEPQPPRTLDRGINRELETICLKCLSKEPARRYASAQALAEDLERWLKGEPIVARPMSRVQRARRWATRHPGVVVLLLALLVAGAWGVYAAVDAWRHGIVERRLAQAEESAKWGETLCERGEIDDGLLWLARALELSPAAASDQQERIRDAIAGWLRVRGGRDVLPQWQVDEVVVSPDDRTIATVTHNKEVARLYDVETGLQVGDTMCHPLAAWDVGFRKKDSKLVKAVLPATATFYEPITTRAGRVRVLEMSPDRELLLTQEGDKTLRLYRAIDGQPVGEPMVEQAKIDSVYFSPDCETVVSVTTANNSSFVRFWSAATGKARSKPQPTQSRYFGLLSPDGSLLVRGIESAHLELFNVRTSEVAELGTRPEHGKGHNVIRQYKAFAPDSRTLICSRSDNALEVWDLKQPLKPALLTTLPTPGAVDRVEFSHNGEILLASIHDDGVACWKTDKWTRAGEPIRPPGKEAILRATLTPDGKRVLIADNKPKTVLVLHDVETGAKRAEFDWSKESGGYFQYAFFTPDGKRLVIKGEKRVEVRDVATGQLVGRPISLSWADHPTLSPDGKQLLIQRNGSIVSLWDSTSGRRLGTDRESWTGSSPLFSPKGDWLVWYQSHQEKVQLYNIPASQERSFDETQSEGRFPVSLLRPLCRNTHQFSPDGRWLLTAAGWLLELDRPQAVARRLEDKSSLRGGGFLRDSQLILTHHTEGVAPIRLWETNTAKNVGQRAGPVPQFTAFPSGGDNWFAASEREIKCLQGASEKQIWHLDVAFKLIDLTLTPDGKCLAVLFDSDKCLLLDPATGTRWGQTIPCDHEWGRQDVPSPFQRTGVVAFSPDGRSVATAVLGQFRPGDRALRRHLIEMLVCFQVGPPPIPLRPHFSGVVQVWETQTSKPLGEPLKHPSAVVAVAYSPDGKLLATGCEDGSVRIWDIARVKQLGPAMPHEGPVLRLAFDSQGKALWTSAILMPKPLRIPQARHRVWDLLQSRDGSPQRMRTWLEIQTRRALDGDAIRNLSDDELRQRQQALDRLGGPPS